MKAASTAGSTRTSGRTSAGGAARNSARTGAVRRRGLRRVRSALEPVREAPRRDRDAHPGLQVDRLGDHRRERLRHVRPVRHRQDPLHRPRQRLGTAVPGIGGIGTFTYDVVRISLPRLWAGPNYTTGRFNAARTPPTASSSRRRSAAKFDLGGIFQYVNDMEVDGTDYDLDDGREINQRFRNSVVGLAFGVHRPPRSTSQAPTTTPSPTRSAARAGQLLASAASRRSRPGSSTTTRNLNVDFNDIAGSGVTISRRDSHRRAVRVDDGRPARVGRAPDRGPRRGLHVPGPVERRPSGCSPATRRASASAAGTATPSSSPRSTWTTSSRTSTSRWPRPPSAGRASPSPPCGRRGPSSSSGEYTYLDYDTNWQAFGDDSRPSDSTIYPAIELDTGVGHNFRSAYAPFQDKQTDIAVARVKYTFDVGKGLDVWGKFKTISETDDRLNDARFLPYAARRLPRRRRAVRERRQELLGRKLDVVDLRQPGSDHGRATPRATSGSRSTTSATTTGT